MTISVLIFSLKLPIICMSNKYDPESPRRGRPLGSFKKVGKTTPVSIRLDELMVQGLKNRGGKWQPRLNAALLMLADRGELDMTAEAVDHFRNISERCSKMEKKMAALEEINYSLSLENLELYSQVVDYVEKAKYEKRQRNSGTRLGEILSQLTTDIHQGGHELERGRFLKSRSPVTQSKFAEVALKLRALADQLSPNSAG